MALALDADEVGLYAVVECDVDGCERHVTARPIATPVDAKELLEVALGWALDEGWLVAGLAWCPEHRGGWDAHLVDTVGEGRPWALVGSPLVNRSSRLS